MKWEYEEAILLVDLFNYTKCHEKEEIEKAIQRLSKFLLCRAKKNGYKVDDKFRNVTGIKMKLQNIEYLSSRGEHGLSSYSALDARVYRFSLRKPADFMKKVKEVKEKYWRPDDKIDSEKKKVNEISTHPKNQSCINNFKLSETIKQKSMLLYTLENKLSISNEVKVKGKETVKKQIEPEYNEPLISVETNYVNSVSERSNFVDEVEDNKKRLIDGTEFTLLDKELIEACVGTPEKILPIIAMLNSFIDCQKILQKKRKSLLEIMDTVSISPKQERYKEGYALLDIELIEACIEAPGKVLPIMTMLNNYIDYEKILKKKRDALLKMMNTVPVSRHTTYAIGYINLFSEKESIRRSLQRLCKDKYTLLKDTINRALYLENGYEITLEFINWCAFDIKKEIAELFTNLYKKEKMKNVIILRASGKTLESTGIEMGVTRERVRQIESSAKGIFETWYNESKILSKIVAIQNGDTVLTPEILKEYFGEYKNELLYLLRIFEARSYIYDSRLNLFIVDNPELIDKVQNYVEALPEMFNESKMKSILSDVLSKGISKVIVERAILDEYKLTGSTYHRVRLSLAHVYSIILQRYYKEGIKAYDDSELNEFRQHVLNDFGNIKLPMNNRALTSRITSVSILCGRGIYRPKEGISIPESLVAKICNYIENSENVIFLTNMLFSIFEDELVAEGIDNKYYLQGILHESYGDKFRFTRDYISKDESVTSVYMDIVQYIKRFNYPISRKQLKCNYPGITDIVFNFAVSDPNILNYFGNYLHCSRIEISESEKLYFNNVLIRMTAATGYCHCKDIYDYIKNDDPMLLKRIFILYAFSLFSVLEYLFREAYQFLRPYIAKPGVRVEHMGERLNELIKSSEEIMIADISEFSRENHFQIQSILDYVNLHNNTHLIKNEDVIASIESLGVDETCALFVEQEIVQEIASTVMISELYCIHHLPEINVPWTEWLVYSVLKKWSTKLDVDTTSKQFRMSIPVVALKGQLDMSMVSNSKACGKVIETDNMDEIDNLISDFIDDEIGDLTGDDF